MSRLPSLRPVNLWPLLKKTGFVEHHQRGSHLYRRHPDWHRMTTVPMHAGDLPRGTVRAFLQQSGLTEEQFIALL